MRLGNTQEVTERRREEMLESCMGSVPGLLTNRENTVGTDLMKNLLLSGQSLRHQSERQEKKPSLPLMEQKG